mgnify:CR=1 FL=1
MLLLSTAKCCNKVFLFIHLFNVKVNTKILRLVFALHRRQLLVASAAFVFLLFFHHRLYIFMFDMFLF